MPSLMTGVDEAVAVEDLHAAGHTDGLPVVVPTPSRVERMCGGADPLEVVGRVAPSGRVATIEDVAVNAVMAGCLSTYFPVVVAALRAVLQPQFNLGALQATTHSVAAMIVVNGPAREHCGPLASGHGSLGPGHRANASIGRALRLILMNIGDGRPGVGDMSQLGHPGKFTYCLAEAEEHSPFEPLHVSRGFGKGQSAVTVLGLEAPHSLMSVSDSDDAASAERLLAGLSAVVGHMGSNTALSTGLQRLRGTVLVVLNPDHASVLHRVGHTRATVAASIVSTAGNPRSEMSRLFPTFFPSGADGWCPALEGPDQVMIVVAGGRGVYSAVMPFWGGGDDSNQPVSAAVTL